MPMKRSITGFVLALVQTIFWAPYLFPIPWTLPEPMKFGRYVLWSDFHFDLGSAIDFIPAVAMVLAGVLGMVVGLRRDLASPFLIWTIRADLVAIFVLTAI